MYPQTQVAQNKPIAAAVLAIIAGVLGLIFAILALIGSLYLFTLSSDYFDITGLAAIALAESIWIFISAILVLVGGSRIYSHPADHTKWGVVILLFSIIGLGVLAASTPDWTGLVGLLIAIMGIIAGILSLVFKPVFAPQQTYGYQQPPTQPAPPPPTTYQQPQPTYQQQPYTGQQPIKRICPNCGRVINEEVKFCPHCGFKLA